MQLATYRDPDPIGNNLRTIIRHHAAHSPRSQQTRLGPSEIGEPCPRKLAYKLMHETAVNNRDPWASIVGTATHTWLADTFEHENTRLGYRRYITEITVEPYPGLTGSCDLYDAENGGTVIDHKIVGPTSMTRYKKHGPSDQYLTQIHLYALGITKLGLPVANVAIAHYPRNGTLGGLYLWHQPYDPQRAEQAMRRVHHITELAVALDVEHEPGNYAHIPAKPSHMCTYCEFYRPATNTGVTCPGHLENNNSTSTTKHRITEQ